MKSIEELDADQLKCIHFINSGADSLICADVGTGKTVISLTAILNEITSNDINSPQRWLILAPLLVATQTWATEIEEWDHLKKLTLAVGCGNEKKRLEAIHSGAQIVVMNYENLPWLMENFPKVKKGAPETLPFDGLVCDEIDKLKSVSSARFKSFRCRIAQFKKRIGLTGTAVPNDLTELWGQMYVVDNGHLFGRSFYKWREKYFYPTDYNQYNWTPFPTTKDDLISAMAPLTYRLKAKNLPTVTILPPTKMVLPTDAQIVYRVLARDFVVDINDDLTIEATNSATLSGKLQQICAGFLYQDDKDKNPVWLTDKKIKWITAKAQNFTLVSDEKSSPAKRQLLIIYNFVEELEALKKSLPGLHYLGGGVSKTKAEKAIKLWNNNEISVLALHPQSASHGLNLQKSGAHHIAFLTVPWSGGVFKQVVGRLARRGNPAKEIFIHTCVFEDTVDEKVLRVVNDKMSLLEDFHIDLEKITA